MSDESTYTAVTHAIRVSVLPIYLEDQSEPESQRYVWAYRVEIENNSDKVVQLRSRYWRITDSLGRVQEVRGRGVVGEEPVLRPGESFQYTSGTPLATPSGFMVGAYQMETVDGDLLNIEIPAFSLDSPDTPRRLH